MEKSEKIYSVYWHYATRQLILIGDGVLESYKIIPKVVRPYPGKGSKNGMQLMVMDEPMNVCMHFINDSIAKLQEAYGTLAE
jgi:hypothetical protein